jgi:hypothetical protein
MVMIGELVRTDERSAVSAFEIKEGNLFVENGFFREAGIVENIAQTAALHAGYNRDVTKPVQTGFIGSVNNLVIHQLPKVGDRLETTIWILHEIFGATVIGGKVTCGGTVLAECEMKIFLKENQH